MPGLVLALLVVGAAVCMVSTVTVAVQLVRRPAVVPAMVAGVILLVLVGSLLLARDLHAHPF